MSPVMGIVDWFTKEPQTKPSASEEEMRRLGETLRRSSRQASEIARDLDEARRKFIDDGEGQKHE